MTQTSSSVNYTEHIAHLKRVFEKRSIHKFLEFGLGFSTKYFLDHADEVISVEFVTPGAGPEWMKECLHLYRSFSNWTPIAFFSGSKLDTRWAPNKHIGADSV